MAEERQITFSPKNHNLDNNDNFSGDGKFLCYDTREIIGPGIGNSLSIEKVEIDTAIETVLYAPEYVTGDKAAPGVGAASYSPVANKVGFIHGPLLGEVAERGYYDKPNRRGAEVVADGSQRLEWLDFRDVAADRPTLPGAHRGGTHRHEYSLDGKRIGFTYDDFLLPKYGRTIGYMVEHPDAPGDASHYFALLVRVVPTGTAKPGEFEIASGDSWIGREGLMRAFIGKIREDDGTYSESLFIVDVPADIDITTAKAGTATEYPRPPQGLRIRRLTHQWAGGTMRGTIDGTRIAYLGKAKDGSTQIFIIPSDGSDRSDDPAKLPVQATAIPDGAVGSVRWHPSGNSVAYLNDGGIATTCVQPGPLFGKTMYLTPHGDAARTDLVWSPDGSRLAYGKAVPTKDDAGKVVKSYSGADCIQLFIVEFPDENGNGIADTLES